MKLLFILFFVSVRGGQLDFYKMEKLQTCRRTDRDCLTLAVQHALGVLDEGNRFLNFPSMQPLEVPQWSMNAGSLMAFEQKYNEIKLYNHARCSVENARLSFAEREFALTFDFYNPETKFKAEYQYKNATLMGMVLADAGNLTFEERGYNGSLKIQGDVIEGGATRYVVIRDVFLKRERPSGVTYSIETGDDEHDRNATKIFNDNSDALYDDVGDEFRNLYVFAYHNVIDAFFSTIPFDEMFPE
ncbi:hypothetical protein FQR65_LT14593 [Abscondita terminalis]|nr:hypothetical protein FQR65_LT14593 [Abscondita terminalis]